MHGRALARKRGRGGGKRKRRKAGAESHRGAKVGRRGQCCSGYQPARRSFLPLNKLQNFALMKPHSRLETRLSSTSTTGSGVLLVLCFLLLGVTVFLTISNFHNWPHLACTLLLTVIQTYYATFYQVSLAGDTITITRLLSPTVQYKAQEFIDLQPSNARRHSLQIRFTDGRSFIFLPQLKTTSWSIYSILPEVFIKHRTREIKRAAGALLAG